VSEYRSTATGDPGSRTADLRGKEIGGNAQVEAGIEAARHADYVNVLHKASVPPIIARHFFGRVTGGGAP